MHYHCITIDFDNTLAHFVGRDGSKGFFPIFEKHGIPRATVEQCYEATKESGFSVEKLLNELSLRGVMPCFGTVFKEQLQEEFAGWLQRSLILYPDSLAALTMLQKQHIPICIITVGDERFQRRKIQLVHPPHDEVIVVPHFNDKADAEKKVLVRFGGPIVLVDDKAKELDAIRDAGLDEAAVETVHINRADSPYRSQQAKYHHHEIFSLAQLLEELAMR